MSITGERRPGPDSRMARRVHDCDYCGAQAETPAVKMMATPGNWTQISIRHNNGFQECQFDLCSDCWGSEQARASILNSLYAEWKRRYGR